MVTTQFFAMKDRRYLHQHGLDERLLGQVAAKAFRCGELNPDAWRRKPLSVDEIMAARVINPPLTQYMLCSPSEGATAVVLASDERAADLSDRPVRLAAVAKRTRQFGSFEVFALVAAGARGAQPVRRRRGRGVRARRCRAVGRPGRPAPGHRLGRRDLPHGRDRAVRARRAAAAHRRRRDGADADGCRSTPTAAASPTASRSERPDCGRCARSSFSSRAAPATARSRTPRRSASPTSTARPASARCTVLRHETRDPGRARDRRPQWRARTRPLDWLAVRAGCHASAPSDEADAVTDYAVFQNISHEAEQRAARPGARVPPRSASTPATARSRCRPRSAVPGCRCATSSRSPPRSRRSRRRSRPS